MFDLQTLLTFYVAVFAMQVTPGPDVILIMGRGIGQGKRVALLTALGAGLVSGFIQVPLLVLGIASLIQTSPLAFECLKWLGAAYLFWLAFKLLKQSRGELNAPASEQFTSDWTAIKEGVISNLTNPKVLVFMIAFLPQFVDAQSEWSISLQLFALGVLQKVSGFAVLAAYALGAGTFGDWLNKRPRLLIWQKRFTGLIMLALGLKLAFGGDVRSVRL